MRDDADSGAIGIGRSWHADDGCLLRIWLVCQFHRTDAHAVAR